MKICMYCDLFKDLSEFNKDKASKEGFTNMCKKCNKKRTKKYRDEMRKAKTKCNLNKG